MKDNKTIRIFNHITSIKIILFGVDSFFNKISKVKFIFQSTTLLSCKETEIFSLFLYSFVDFKLRTK